MKAYVTGIGIGAVIVTFIYVVWPSSQKVKFCRPECYFLRSADNDLASSQADMIALCQSSNKYMTIGTAATLSDGLNYLEERGYPLCHKRAVPAAKDTSKCEVCSRWHNATMLWQWDGDGQIQQFPTVVCDRCKE
jgi:hypothetical protein